MNEAITRPQTGQATDPDTALFEQPLFQDPSARALSRVGVVDVGSNSVRLVVFDGAARSPAYFYNEKIMCALGAGLSETGMLNSAGRVRALNALKRFQTLADGMGLPTLTVVATAAVRDATDGPDFCAEVERETGMRIWVTADGRLHVTRCTFNGAIDLAWADIAEVIEGTGRGNAEAATTVTTTWRTTHLDIVESGISCRARKPEKTP